MENIYERFEVLIKERMERFKYLLQNAKFEHKQYQYDGVEWCIKNELRPNPPENVRGGFIADEMGLGKTIMMIGTMFANFLPHTLIVVPPILIQQWHKEIFKATGHEVLVFHGKFKKYYTQNDINNARIVLTTYNTLIFKDCPLKKLVWNRVIFDEAHHLRNFNTLRYSSCKQIKARVRWLITGTPIQNKRSDFYSLCCATGMKSAYYMDTSNWTHLKHNFILRRTKQQVGIDLPSITKTELVVEWKNDKEMSLSEEIHALLTNQTHVPISKRKKIAQIFGKGGILTALLRAKQSCIMPELMRLQMEMFYQMGWITNEALEALSYSSKLDYVTNFILERKNNEKGKIIFCQFKHEIDAIASRLREGGLKKVITYDGRNSGGQNLASLSKPADALIIQIQTGCEGLNLQDNFSEIYFVSPHWNPCVEDQAIARCHRIGQKKPVDVFKFEMRGFLIENNIYPNTLTLDKYVNNTQEIKREMSKQILQE